MLPRCRLAGSDLVDPSEGLMSLALETVGLVGTSDVSILAQRPTAVSPHFLQSWLRQYGPLTGLALMGVSAVVVVDGGALVRRSVDLSTRSVAWPEGFR